MSENYQQNSLEILERKMERVGVLLLKCCGNHIAMVGDEDLKSWEFAAFKKCGNPVYTKAIQKSNCSNY